MESKKRKKILFVDYENIQSIDLSIIEAQDFDVKIFVGENQTKIPFELVQSAQKLGPKVEWLKIKGSGKNALDFHIAFYLGKTSSESSGMSFWVLSKDKGFDPLVKHMNSLQVPCRRIQSLIELSNQSQKLISQHSESIDKVVGNLSKIQKNKRPRTRKTLGQYIKSFLSKQNLSQKDIDTLLDALFVQKKISEASNHLTYYF